MRTRRTFRPAAVVTLEDRAVPSLFGLFGGFRGRLDNRIATLPARDAQQVQRAFSDFDQTITQDARTILLPNGTTNPAANRAAFDAKVVQDLAGLETAIGKAIGNLPTAQGLAAWIHTQLFNDPTTPNPNSLQALLQSDPTPKDTSIGSLRTFNREATGWIDQVANRAVQQVRSAQGPAGSVDTATVQASLRQINSAFQTFRRSYFNNVSSILLAPNTQPSDNRDRFNAAVANDLQTLNASITRALPTLPTAQATALTTTIQQDLGTGSTGGGLKARLDSIRTPGGRFFGSFLLRLQSNLAISTAQGQVNNDVINAVRQVNVG